MCAHVYWFEVLLSTERLSSTVSLIMFVCSLGQLHTALAYIERAIRIEESHRIDTPATSLLNLCAIYSEMGR